MSLPRALRTPPRAFALRFIVASLLSGFGLLPLGTAQETAPAATTPQSSTPRESPAGTNKTDSAQNDWERLIYVPYRNLKQVFDKDGAAAFMPYGQFLKLWESLQRIDLKQPPKPPVGAVITKAAYSGRVEKEIARIDAELTVQVLAKGWVELPIRFGEAAIGKMTADDEKILLQATGNGAYTLLLPKDGEHKIRFELAARVRSSPDGRSLEFDCPPSGITTFDLTVPGGDQSIEVVPAGIVAPGAPAENATKVTAELGATAKIAARWRPRVSTAPVMEVLTTVSNTLDVRVADGLAHTHAALTYHVLRGQLDQLRIGVPLEHRILDVTAAGLKSWKVVREEKGQVVTVDLLGGEARLIVVELQTERPVAAEPFAVAGVDEDGTLRGIHALGEVRENGLLIISQGPELTLSVEQLSGLVRVEAAEVPEPLRRPDSSFYRFYTPKVRLLLAARPIEPRLLVDRRTQLTYRDDELQLVDRLQYVIERAGVFELRLKLPPGLKVDRVDCEAMKEFHAPEGADELIVAMREKTRGSVALVVTGHLPLDPAQTEAAPLPLLDPENVARESGVLIVYAPPALEVIADEKKVQGAQPTRVEADAPPANTRLVAAWSYTRHPEIPVRTERKPTRMTAALATTIDIRQDLTEVVTLLGYDVQFAGIDTLRFAVPEGIAESVQIETADGSGLPIRQKSRDPEASDGWVTWTVVLQREAIGPVPIRVRYDLTPKEEGLSRSLTVSPLRVLESPGKAPGTTIVPAAVSGEITVRKDRALSVAARSGPELEAIDVRELTLLPQTGYLAYRYFKQPEQLANPLALELTATRNEIQPVVETVIGQSLIEAVVTEDKSVTFRCRYRLKTSQRQRLTLELPKSVEILDALVAGRRVDLEKQEGAAGDWTAFGVNVARATASDEPFVLAIVFRAPFTASPLRDKGGNVKLRLPRFEGAGATQSAVAVQQVRVAVWVPREFSLVGVPDGFVPEHPTGLTLANGAQGWTGSTQALEGWFGDAGSGGLFAFTPSGKAYVYDRLGSADTLEASYWRTAWFAWTISGAVFLVALVLSRTSWENRLTIVLLAAFGLALYALRDADLVINILGAARFGLLAMAAYWLIHALTRPRPSKTAGPSHHGGPSTVLPSVAAVIPPPESAEPRPETE